MREGKLTIRNSNFEIPTAFAAEFSKKKLSGE